jgi:hypothetical protein
MKYLLIILFGLVLASCSGHINPPNMVFGKKCTEAENGRIVYSYVWLHKQGEELKANKETCEKIKKHAN